MLFNSLEFLIFFPIVVLGYFIMPKRIKDIWLLIASYYFYMCWNAKYAILILFSTIVTFFSGIILEKIKTSERDDKSKRTLMNWTVSGSFVTNLGVLAYFKYTNFFLSIVTRAFAAIHISLNIPPFDILLPVGISFYTFQALSYTMDVYRDDIYAEKNFFRYALFVSFFPQLVAGPIERSKNLLKQLAVERKFSFENLREGLMIMIWGFFVKIVIADRAALYVNTVYGDLDTYGGWFVTIAALLFAMQIYCDFYGYSLIAKGAAKILGIELMENFNYPYLRTSIADFWRGWHISLSTWFRDYLYIPLGGNRKGKIRKYINLMIVFLTSGLWHGASFAFVIWGGLHGAYQIIGDSLMPIRKKIRKLLNINPDDLGYKVVAIIITFLLAAFAFIFFRADSAGVAIKAIKSIREVYNPWVLFDGSLYTCGLDQKNFGLLMFALLILLIADICKKNNIVIREIVIKQHVFLRCMFLAIALMFILIFGIWGPAYDAAAFIYFQF